MHERIAKQCYHGVDGYLMWDPKDTQGLMTARDLRLIADYLDEANKDWDAKVREDLHQDM